MVQFHKSHYRSIRICTTIIVACLVGIVVLIFATAGAVAEETAETNETNLSIDSVSVDSTNELLYTIVADAELAQTNGQFEFEHVDGDGVESFTESIQIDRGSNSYSVDIGDVPYGDYFIEIIVEDAVYESTITVPAESPIPAIEYTADEEGQSDDRPTINPDTEIVFDGSYSDSPEPGEDIEEYEWVVWGHSSQYRESGSGEEFSPRLDSNNQLYTAQLTVHDSLGQSASATTVFYLHGSGDVESILNEREEVANETTGMPEYRDDYYHHGYGRYYQPSFRIFHSNLANFHSIGDYPEATYFATKFSPVSSPFGDSQGLDFDDLKVLLPTYPLVLPNVEYNSDHDSYAVSSSLDTIPDPYAVSTMEDISAAHIQPDDTVKTFNRTNWSPDVVPSVDDLAHSGPESPQNFNLEDVQTGRHRIQPQGGEDRSYLPNRHLNIQSDGVIRNAYMKYMSGIEVAQLTFDKDNGEDFPYIVSNNPDFLFTMDYRIDEDFLSQRSCSVTERHNETNKPVERVCEDYTLGGIRGNRSVTMEDQDERIVYEQHMPYHPLAENRSISPDLSDIHEPVTLEYGFNRSVDEKQHILVETRNITTNEDNTTHTITDWTIESHSVNHNYEKTFHVYANDTLEIANLENNIDDVEVTQYVVDKYSHDADGYELNDIIIEIERPLPSNSGIGVSEDELLQQPLLTTFALTADAEHSIHRQVSNSEQGRIPTGIVDLGWRTTPIQQFTKGVVVQTNQTEVGTIGPQSHNATHIQEPTGGEVIFPQSLSSVMYKNANEPQYLDLDHPNFDPGSISFADGDDRDSYATFKPSSPRWGGSEYFPVSHDSSTVDLHSNIDEQSHSPTITYRFMVQNTQGKVTDVNTMFGGELSDDQITTHVIPTRQPTMEFEKEDGTVTITVEYEDSNGETVPAKNREIAVYGSQERMHVTDQNGEVTVKPISGMLQAELIGDARASPCRNSEPDDCVYLGHIVASHMHTPDYAVIRAIIRFVERALLILPFILLLFIWRRIDIDSD